MLNRRDQALVYQVVIHLEQIETDHETLIQLPELRKVGDVLDAMVLIEVLEEAVELRDEGALELVSVDPLSAKCVHDAGNFASLMPQGSVHLQPEVGELAEVCVRTPILTRVVRTKKGNVIRNACALTKAKPFWGKLVHQHLSSQQIAAGTSRCQSDLARTTTAFSSTPAPIRRLANVHLCHRASQQRRQPGSWTEMNESLILRSAERL